MIQTLFDYLRSVMYDIKGEFYGINTKVAECKRRIICTALETR